MEFEFYWYSFICQRRHLLSSW